MQDGSTTPRFFTTKELADFLRTTPKGVYHLVARGQLPQPRHRGRRLLFDLDEVLASLSESRVPSPTQE